MCRKIAVYFLITMSVLSLSACGNKGSAVESSATPVAQSVESPENSSDSKVQSATQDDSDLNQNTGEETPDSKEDGNQDTSFSIPLFKMITTRHVTKKEDLDYAEVAARFPDREPKTTYEYLEDGKSYHYVIGIEWYEYALEDGTKLHEIDVPESDTEYEEYFGDVFADEDGNEYVMYSLSFNNENSEIILCRKEDWKTIRELLKNK